MASTLKINNIDTASGTTITLPTGKTLVGTDEGAFRVPGTILQVVQGTFGNKATSASSSFVATGLSVSITPKSSTSKILLSASFMFSQTKSSNATQDNMKDFTLFRDSTNIAPHNSRFFSYQNHYGVNISGGTAGYGEQCAHCAIEVLDSPSTTSAITYTLHYKNDNPNETTIHFNARGHGSEKGSAILTAQEVAQ